MQERQLTNLYIQLGLERGKDIESIVEELAELPLPSFVSSQTFRDTLIDAAEEQLKLQLDQRIDNLRQQISQEDRLHGRVNQSPPSRSDQAEVGNHTEASTSTPDDSRLSEPETIIVDEEPPADATTVWEPRNG